MIQSHQLLNEQSKVFPSSHSTYLLDSYLFICCFFNFYSDLSVSLMGSIFEEHFSIRSPRDLEDCLCADYPWYSLDFASKFQLGLTICPPYFIHTNMYMYTHVYKHINVQCWISPAHFKISIFYLLQQHEILITLCQHESPLDL